MEEGTLLMLVHSHAYQLEQKSYLKAQDMEMMLKIVVQMHQWTVFLCHHKFTYHHRYSNHHSRIDWGVSGSCGITKNTVWI